MSLAPDPADLAPSRDPAAYGKRRLFTAGFFAWTGLCLVCLVAGVVIGRQGAFAPPKPAASAVAELGRPAPSAQPAPAVAPSPTISAPATPVAGPTSPAALVDRVARLEAASSRANSAAAMALAAAQLSTAAEGSGPFEEDIAAYARLAPADPDLAALASLAGQGAPTRAALAAALPDLETEAALAARQPGKRAGLLSQLWALFGKVVVVRHIDPAAPGVDGVLARAADEASAGDLSAATHTLGQLPPSARAPLGPWLAAAQRRLEIDRRIEALRARALDGLVKAEASAS
jgi:hypothetical protein